MAPHKTKCCKVAGCKNQRSSSNILLHSVPKHKVHLEKWKLALHLQRLPQKSLVCSDHFTPDDYIKATDNDAKQLKQEAVPSQNILLQTDKKQSQSKRPLKKRQRSDVSESDSTSISISDGFSSSDDEPVVKTLSSPRIKVVDTKKLLNKSKTSRVKTEPLECKTASTFICIDPIKYEDDTAAIDEEVHEKMDRCNIKACLLCLAASPLSPLGPLAPTYRVLAGTAPAGRARVCAGCAAGLRGAAGLRARARRAQEALRWLSGRGELKQENIEEIARSSFNLKSTLIARHYEPNHYDRYYNADEPVPEPPPVDERLKQENIAQELGQFSENEAVIATDDDFDATEDIKPDDTTPADITPKKKVKKRKKSSKTAEKVMKNGAKKLKIKEPSKNEMILSKYMDMKVLTVEEARAEIDKRMESNNFKHAQYKCTMCGKTFEYEQICAKHMRLHDTISGTYSCEVCQLRYPTKNQLTKHNKSSHKFLFNCRKCDFQSHCRIRSIRHLDRHEGTVYNCKHCDAHFVCHTSLLGHLRIRHPSNLACALCGYSFLSARGIKYHQNLAHKHSDRQIPADGPRCEECDVRFVDAHAHQTHLRVSAAHATGKLKYNSSHISNSEPRPRRRRMAPDVNIACEQCGLKMSSFLEYRKHFLRAHPYKKRALLSTTEGDVLCELCGATFTSKAVLKEHMAKHLGLGHTCDVCGRTYSTKHSLIAHRRKHEGVKYGCDTCGKQFSQQSNRERHVRYAHSDVKSVACEICGKCFKHVGSRNFHMSHVHLKKPWPKRGARDKQADRRRRASETEPPLWAARVAPALVQ